MCMCMCMCEGPQLMRKGKYSYLDRCVTNAVKCLSSSLMGMVQNPDTRSSVVKKSDSGLPLPDAKRSNASTVSGSGLSWMSNFSFSAR